MHIRCPHCQSPIEVAEEQRPEEVVCPSCGSSFRVEPGTTGGWSPQEGTRKIGKYELIDKVGVGAFGTVYMARDTELDRVVAVNVPLCQVKQATVGIIDCRESILPRTG